MPTRRELKQEARAAMRGNRPSVFLITLVYMIIVLVLQILTYRLMYPGREILAVFRQLAEGRQVLEDTSFGSSALQLALSLMNTAVNFGFMIVCVNISRGISAGFGELFDGFGLFFKVIWLNALISIYVALWSMFFLIPGIIATYRYSMAYYILLDDPELRPGECLRRSSQLMWGNKGKLFLLELSFVGWYLLSVIPGVMLFVMPYEAVSRACFYNALRGRCAGEDTGPDGARGPYGQGEPRE